MALHLLGIRHHGPGSARSVIAALDELQPSIVLVESPAETSAAFAWVGDAGLEPPVALLGHVVDDPRRAVFAPLAVVQPRVAGDPVGERPCDPGRSDRPPAREQPRRRPRRRLDRGGHAGRPSRCPGCGCRRAGRRAMVGRRDRAPRRRTRRIPGRGRGDGGGPVGHGAVGVGTAARGAHAPVHPGRGCRPTTR